MVNLLNHHQQGPSSAALAASERSGEAANAASAAPPPFHPPVPDSEVITRPHRRSFTAAYKRSVLNQADACQDTGAIGALLRREGLYISLHPAILAVKRRMLQAFVYQCVYASRPLSALRVYARKRIKMLLDGDPDKLLIPCVLTPVNKDADHVYQQHPIWE